MVSSPAKNETTLGASKNSGSKIVKAKDTMSLLATSIPVIGFLGTIAVWAATNYYVGDVIIATNKPFTSLTIKAFDKKGQESTFHTPRFQLMPGSYHLEIQADNDKARHADTEVAFQKVATIPIANSEDDEESKNQANDIAPDTASSSTESQKKRHWWQLWRRSEN